MVGQAGVAPAFPCSQGTDLHSFDLCPIRSLKSKNGTEFRCCPEHARFWRPGRANLAPSVKNGAVSRIRTGIA